MQSRSLKEACGERKEIHVQIHRLIVLLLHIHIHINILSHSSRRACILAIQRGHGGKNATALSRRLIYAIYKASTYDPARTWRQRQECDSPQQRAFPPHKTRATIPAALSKRVCVSAGRLSCWIYMHQGMLTDSTNVEREREGGREGGVWKGWEGRERESERARESERERESESLCVCM